MDEARLLETIRAAGAPVALSYETVGDALKLNLDDIAGQAALGAWARQVGLDARNGPGPREVTFVAQSSASDPEPSGAF